MKCRGDEGSKPSFLDGDEVRYLDKVIYTNLYIQTVKLTCFQNKTISGMI
jgi:hypothetical protein